MWPMFFTFIYEPQGPKMYDPYPMNFTPQESVKLKAKKSMNPTYTAKKMRTLRPQKKLNYIYAT